MAGDFITGREFDRAVDLLSNQMTEGFTGIHSRMGRFEDEVLPTLKTQGEDIAVLKYRATQAKVVKRQNVAQSGGLGAVIAGVIYGAFEGIKTVKGYFGG